MKNKYVQNCRFVDHTKFQCIMTTLKRLFKNEFEGGTGKEPKMTDSFSFTPTSLKLELYGLTSDFTRLIMKTKYVCHGLISLHYNFHDNWTTRTVASNIKNCRWGEKGKEPNDQFPT